MLFQFFHLHHLLLFCLLLLLLLPLPLVSQNPSCTSVYTCYLDSSDGWVGPHIPPSSDTIVIYVSSSTGDDDLNDGLSEGSPLQTPSVGYELLRDGYPDWLLFRRGDSFDQVVLAFFAKGGRSAEEPMVVGAYGDPVADPKPVFVVGGDVNPLSSWGNLEEDGRIVFAHVAFVSLAFSGVGMDQSSSPMRFLGPMQDVLFEDMHIEETTTVIFQVFRDQPIIDVTFRRSVIRNTYSRGEGHCQGIYAHGLRDCLFEENFFYHNGWTQNPTYLAQGHGQATMFNHNTYLHWEDGLTVRNNVYMRGASMNIKFRCDSNRHPARNLVVDNNFFFGGEIGIGLGGNEALIPNRFIGATVMNNVFSDIGEPIPEFDGNTNTDRTLGWSFDVVGVQEIAICGNLFFQDHRRNGYGINMNHNVDTAYVWRNVILGTNNSGLLTLNRHEGTDIFRSPILIRENIIQDETDRQGGVSNNDMDLIRVSGVPLGIATFEGNSLFSGQPKTEDWVRIHGLNYDSDDDDDVSSAVMEWLITTTNSSLERTVFPYPQRTFLTYIQDELGLSTIDEYVSLAAAQSPQAGWRVDLAAQGINAYLREAFGMQAIDRSSCVVVIDPTLRIIALAVGASLAGLAAIILVLAVIVILVVFVGLECSRKK